jgi:predicted dehydrogenase
VSDTIINAAVIGVGVGTAHIEGYLACPNAKLAALCDADPKRLAQAKERYGVERTYTDIAELLRQDDIQAVSVALPNDLHAPISIQALEAGKHVLCEKPLAISGDSAQGIVDARDKSGKKLMVCFNYRYRPDARWLKQLIHDGKMGDAYFAKAGWIRNSGIPGWGGWFTRKERSGGGPLIDLGVHILDMSLWLLDYPKVKSVTGVTFAEFGPRDMKHFGGRLMSQQGTRPAGAVFNVEDFAAALIRFENGSALQIEVSWASHTKAGRDDYFVTLYGSEGGSDLYVANYTNVDTVVFHSEEGGAPSDTRPTLPGGPRVPSGHALAIDHFINAIINDTQPDATGEQGLALMRLIDAIYESARIGAEVNL